MGCGLFLPSACPTIGRLRPLGESVYPQSGLAPLGGPPAEIIALAAEATLCVAFITEAVAFRLSPESFYSSPSVAPPPSRSLLPGLRSESPVVFALQRAVPVVAQALLSGTAAR